MCWNTTQTIKGLAERPRPITHKKLQRFLGFASIYQCFIKDFSRVAASLVKLISTSIPFFLTPAEELTFSKLKTLVTSTPILVHTNLSRMVFVKADTCNIGIQPVLFQCSSPDLEHRPVPFFPFTPPKHPSACGKADFLVYHVFFFQYNMIDNLYDWAPQFFPKSGDCPVRLLGPQSVFHLVYTHRPMARWTRQIETRKLQYNALQLLSPHPGTPILSG